MKKPRNKSAARLSKHSAGANQAHSEFATVLHIDDDPNDTELFQAAARRANVRFSVRNVSDGEQAIAYLNGRGVYADRRSYPLPTLVLLDLKMPRATGFDVLRWIRHHPESGTLPVVVFSGSELRDDIQQAYAAGADSYLVKPIGFNALVELVKAIDLSWIAGRKPRSPLLASAQSSRPWSPTVAWFSRPDSSDARA